MKRKNRIVIFVITALMLVLTVSGCSLLNDAPPQADEDEIKVMIHLDLQEDIGLLLADHNVNGSTGKGGISNADRSMLKRDSTDLVWSFYKEFLDQPDDTVDMTLQFTVVTEYFDPNYDNDYPEEYMIPMDPISFTADFGRTYVVKITGNQTNGYRAVLVEP